jgi:hypothetical protein
MTAALGMTNPICLDVVSCDLHVRRGDELDDTAGNMTWSDPTPDPVSPNAPQAYATAWDPRAVRDLLFRPARFFRSALPYAPGTGLKVIAWVIGMNYAIGRIERQLVRADLGQQTSATAFYSESWIGFWTVVLISGALSGLLAWYLGTWWFRVRLRWSGAVNPDAARARAVYLHSSLVWAAPTVLSAIVATLTSPSYAAAWADSGWGDVMLLVFPFWSCVVSYRGVRAAFDVRPGAARFWFLIAPAVLITFAIGLFAALYAALG